MHIALICPEMTGHLNPMSTLGQTIRERGHRVSVVGTADAIRFCERSGLEFIEIGAPETRSGGFERDKEQLARMRGWSALRFTAKMLATMAGIILRDAPEAIRCQGVDGMLIDQVTPAGVAVAEALQLPFGIACNALAIHTDPATPPGVTDWPIPKTRWGRARNGVGNVLLHAATISTFRIINRYRREHSLRPASFTKHQRAGLVQIAQQPEFFDLPRPLPRHFHYTGPWHKLERDSAVDFPWEKLDGRPIVYASFGTLQNRLAWLFDAVIEACEPLDVQLVLSMGHAGGHDSARDAFDGIAVPYAPQVALLQKAAALVTHAGLNTALEGLAAGVPMVAIPITNDQPGVARRIVETGVGTHLALGDTNAERIRQALQRVMTDKSIIDAASRSRQTIAEGPGVDHAAQLTLQALEEPTVVERTQ